MKRSFWCFSFLLLLCVACKKSDTSTSAQPYTKYANLPYQADTSVKTDVYVPTGSNGLPAPVIVLLHGGSWYKGVKADYDGTDMYSFFTSSGFVVVDPDFHLVSGNQYTYPYPLPDIDSLLQFVERNSAAWGCDPNKVCLLGRSSGSHLALLYAYAHNTKHRVKAVVDCYGISNLADPTIYDAALASYAQAYIGVPYNGHEQLWQDASPIYHLSGAVPTVIFHGDADMTVDIQQDINLADSLRGRGVPYMYSTWLGVGHAFSAAWWSYYQDATVQFLRIYLNR